MVSFWTANSLILETCLEIREILSSFLLQNKQHFCCFQWKSSSLLDLHNLSYHFLWALFEISSWKKTTCHFYSCHLQWLVSLKGDHTIRTWVGKKFSHARVLAAWIIYQLCLSSTELTCKTLWFTFGGIFTLEQFHWHKFCVPMPKKKQTNPKQNKSTTEN